MAVYVAKLPTGRKESCGHQHKTEGKAVSCARNILATRRFISHVDVYLVGWNAKRERPTEEFMISVVRDANDSK